jgi:squalene-associated FAD-dependent desaturase
VKPVVIVGAGLSGLATGVYLARQNIPVLLLEQKSSPGGRTRSFPDAASGETLDNGQHVLIAGYEATMRFLSEIGSRRHLRIQPRPVLRLFHPSRGFRTLELPTWKPPLNVAGGILLSNLLPPADRLRVLRAGATLLRWGPEKELALADLTIDDWLHAKGQTPEARRSLWEPLAVSIMNEHCATASALVFLRSLRKAFLSRWNASAFAVPTIGLSELLANPAVRSIEARGGAVRTGVDVVGILMDGEHAAGVRTREGSVLEAEGIVLAVPSGAVTSLLPQTLRDSGFLAGLLDAPLSPIISIYLWFESDVMQSDEILGLVDGRVQWIFNRRRFARDSAGGSLNVAETGGLICCVISAAHTYATRTNEELTRLAWDDVRNVYGEEAVPPPLRSVVIREKRATFSSSSAFERLRPTQQTPIRNLFLAGDWTATALPATIEGAVVSAELCAGLVGTWWTGKRKLSMSHH